MRYVRQGPIVTLSRPSFCAKTNLSVSRHQQMGSTAGLIAPRVQIGQCSTWLDALVVYQAPGWFYKLQMIIAQLSKTDQTLILMFSCTHSDI